MLRKLREFILRLRRDHAGAVGIVAAMALPVLIGMSSLVGEYGYVLLVKTENQRVADLAAYAGAIAYNASGTNTAMTNAANAVASLNGVASSNVSASLVNSPTGDGNQAVQVQISTNVPVYLAQVVGAKASVPVGATSDAELNAKASPCVIALSGSGNGIAMSGGTALNTSQCSVGSNASLTLKGGAQITTLSAAYNGSVNIGGGAAINTPSGTAAPLIKKSSTDPLAGTSQVKAAYNGLSNLQNLTTPSGPTVPTGKDVDFTYNGDANALSAINKDGCNAPLPTNGVWTVTCPSGTANFGAITVEGGVTVNFAQSAPATNTYTFSGPVSLAGGGKFYAGSGTFEFAQGLSTSGGAVATFGSGYFWFGMGSGKCNAGSSYSICNGGTQITFGGPSNFVIAGGVYNGGGATISFGSGSANSFQIGASPSGDALSMSGGAQTYMADALGAGDVFQLFGDIDGKSNGGGCTIISAAAEHDINGSIDAKGAVILGSGPYYVSGYVAFGSNGSGGNATCGGSSVGVQGTNVTLVVGGSTTTNASDCKNEAFCVGAGYSNVNLTGPSSGSLAGLAVVGPQNNSNGALFTAGASGTTFSGALYFPNGPITMGGGASVGGGTGNCLEIVGSEVSLSGGSAAASNCTALSSNSSASSIMLVQ